MPLPRRPLAVRIIAALTLGAAAVTHHVEAKSWADRLADAHYNFRPADADRLYSAIATGDEAVSQALAAGADPNAYRVDCIGTLPRLDFHGQGGTICPAKTPLAFAIAQGRYAAAERLVRVGAKLDLGVPPPVWTPNVDTMLLAVAQHHAWPLLRQLLAQHPAPPQVVCDGLLQRILEDPPADVAALRPLSRCGPDNPRRPLADYLRAYPEHADAVLAVLPWLPPLPPEVIERADAQWLERHRWPADVDAHLVFLRALRPRVTSFGHLDLLATALQFPDQRVADWLFAEGADPNAYSDVQVNVRGAFVDIHRPVLSRLVTARCADPDQACERGIDWLLPRVEPHLLPRDYYSPVSDLLIGFLPYGERRDASVVAGKRRVLQRLLDAGLFARDSEHLVRIAADRLLPPELGDRLFAAGLDVDARDEIGNTALMELLPRDPAHGDVPLDADAALPRVRSLLRREHDDDCRLGDLINLRRHGARTDLRDRSGRTGAQLLDPADPCYLGKAWLLAHWQSTDPYEPPDDDAIKRWLQRAGTSH